MSEPCVTVGLVRWTSTVCIDNRRVETRGVRTNKVVHEREELVDESLLHEAVSIERAPPHRFVDEALPIRYEGDTMIISLLEEEPAVEKRLMLKEELRITIRRSEAHRPVRLMLRSEEASVGHIEVEHKTNEDKTKTRGA